MVTNISSRHNNTAAANTVQAWVRKGAPGGNGATTKEPKHALSQLVGSADEGLRIQPEITKTPAGRKSARKPFRRLNPKRLFISPEKK